MWEVPKHRIRAYAHLLRRKQNLKARVTPMPSFKRVRAELKIHSGPNRPVGITPATVILNDLTTQGIKLFTTEALGDGQLISIQLQHPRKFYIQARVVGCHEVPKTHRVLSSMPFKYRVTVQFVFRSSDEVIEVKKFCEEVFSTMIFGHLNMNV